MTEGFILAPTVARLRATVPVAAASGGKLLITFPLGFCSLKVMRKSFIFRV